MTDEQKEHKRQWYLKHREEPEKYKFEIVCETETREQAYEIEKELIREIQPKYNVLKYKNVQEI